MRELLQVAAVALGIIIGVLWTVIGVLLAGVGWATVRQRLAAVFWPQVPARIVSTAVRSVQRLEDQSLFQPQVSYIFAVEGEERTSERISMVGKLYPSEERARQSLAKYPVGMVVMARANPRDPGEAVLERGGGVAGFLLLLLGLGLIAVPLVVAGRFGLPAWPLGILIVVLIAGALLLDGANRRQLAQARRSGLYPPPGRGNEEDVARLLRQGEKALAIRLFREINATDLRTARLRVAEMAEDIRRGK